MVAGESQYLVFLIILPGITAVILLPLIESLLVKSKITCFNFRQKVIPEGMGLLFYLAIIPSIWGAPALPAFSADILKKKLSLATGLAFAGFLDDSMGSKKQKGFKGHFKELLHHGMLTTGVLKTFFIVFYVFTILALTEKNYFIIFVDTAIIAGTANFFNLLDLKPGRAWKMFFLIFFLILFFSGSPDVVILFFPLLVVGLIYLPGELEQRFAMGDTGANLLGGLSGFLLVATLNLSTKLFLLLFLLMIHLVCEKKSLSRIIETNPILNYLDVLGTKKN